MGDFELAAGSSLIWIFLPGFLALGSFFLVLFSYISAGKTSEILWLCHISNLLLALGIFLRLPQLVRPAALCIIPGLFLWFGDALATGDISRTSIVSHTAGLGAAILAMYLFGTEANAWIYAIIWVLLVQQVGRFITVPEVNVNLAHGIYPGWEKIFRAYWQYWIFIIGTAAAVMFGLNRIFMLAFPARG